ncbi:hypothetical protein [uncultured Tateyamaria sp.]|uniref:YciI family protein n=1 Tax=uncultured Tateyamaria sp. TaxID=455651 RepID=UPI002626613C|nr:hypothetical protein [uncultured Tateyamaria sp.]
MYIITLTLGDQKSKAPDFMAGHNDWIARGFDDGVFLLVGSLKPQGGGAILANGTDLASLEQRLGDAQANSGAGSRQSALVTGLRV